MAHGHGMAATHDLFLLYFIKSTYTSAKRSLVTAITKAEKKFTLHLGLKPKTACLGYSFLSPPPTQFYDPIYTTYVTLDGMTFF